MLTALCFQLEVSSGVFSQNLICPEYASVLAGIQQQHVCHCKGKQESLVTTASSSEESQAAEWKAQNLFLYLLLAVEERSPSGNIKRGMSGEQGINKVIC